MGLTVSQRDRITGAFALAGLLLLLAALVYVGVHRHWFRRDLVYRTRFQTAAGIHPGMDLQLRGFTVGRVRRLVLGDDDAVEVELAVDPAYGDRIVPGTVVELTVQPLGFGATLSLAPGREGGEPLPEGSLLPSSDTALGRRLLRCGAAVRPSRHDQAAELLSRLPPLMGHLDSLVTVSRDLLARLDGRLLGGPDATGGGLLASVDSTTRAFGDLARRLDHTVGTLQPLSARLDSFSRHLANPRGLVPLLLGDRGSAARLFRDDGRLYGRIDSLLADLQALSAVLRRDAPELDMLLQGSVAAVDEGTKVLQGLRHNPLLRGGIRPETPPADPFGGYRGGGAP